MSLTISSALQVRTYVVVADSGGEKRSFEHRTWHTILGSSIKNMNTLFPKIETTFFSFSLICIVFVPYLRGELSVFCLQKWASFGKSQLLNAPTLANRNKNNEWLDFDLSPMRQLLFRLTTLSHNLFEKQSLKRHLAESHMLVWAIMEKLKLKGFVHPSVHVDQANVAVKMGAPKRDKIMCSTTTIAAGSWRKRVCTVLRIDWQQVWGLLQLLRRPTEESLVLILASVRN